jgi:hypothetical protein
MNHSAAQLATANAGGALPECIAASVDAEYSYSNMMH